jgi:DNA invertase Pin-like site-specific DNA recombinase
MPRTKTHLRVAIYARVSTDEGKQSPETQLRQLRAYAKSRGFTITGEFIDHATGRNEDRTHYRPMFDAVRKREVDIVLVWRYDRFARSTRALINALTEFKSLGVDFISFQENIDTTTPQGELIFTIMASLAQFESSLISARIKAGMERAKAQGKHTAAIPAHGLRILYDLRWRYLDGQFDVPFVAFKAPRIIEGVATLGTKQMPVFSQTQLRPGGGTGAVCLGADPLRESRGQ